MRTKKKSNPDKQPDNPRQMLSPKVEAAKFLISTARGFIAERLLPKDVDEAIAVWREANEVKP